MDRGITIEVYEKYNRVFKSAVLYKGFPSCSHSCADPLDVRALIPVSSFAKDNQVSIVLYHGRNNYIGEMTVDLDYLLFSEEQENEYTVAPHRACNA